MRKCVVVASWVAFSLVPLLAPAVSDPAQAARMSSARVGSEAEAKAARRSMLALHERLVAQQVELGAKNAITVLVDDQQLAAMAAAPAEGRLKVGVVAPVGVAVELTPVVSAAVTDEALALPYGAVRRDGGEMVWSTAVISPGATGIRLRVVGLDLPEGVELAVFNQRGEAFAYTGRGPLGTGELWTNAVTGDTAYLQLTGRDLTGAFFKVADLGYLGDGFLFGVGAGAEKSFCTYNAPCIENAGCGIDPPASAATDAVAQMQYVSGAFLYACSGGLLNNDGGRDLFLTANHCVSKGGEAASLEAYFFYRVNCNQSCPAAWSKPTTPRTVGASILSTSRTSDYTVLELAQPAPAGAVRLGWNHTDIAFASGTPLYRIAHPATAPQAYSTHTVDTSYGTCRTWPRGSWIYSRDTFGGTEGGSSGSPVVNGSGEVVGQLSGGCGTNVSDPCDSVRNATVDGAFAAYYPSIASLLGPGTVCDPTETCGDGIDNDCNGLIDDGCPPPPTCTDNDADGWCVEDGDCDDANPDVYPGHNDTKGRWGRDGVDNDCNGIIDG